MFRLREPGLPPLHAANTYLVQGQDRALLIDAGAGLAPLAPAIRALTNLPVTCLLTHGHYDHVGGACEFDQRLCHPLAAETLANPTPEATLWKGWLTDAAFHRMPWKSFSMDRYAIAPAPPTGLVADGSVIELGGRSLNIIHLPGHAPDLIGVIDTTSGALFTSDALYAGRMFFDLPGPIPPTRSPARRELVRCARV